ncbi:MAG TPA: hypothetical protein VEC36_01760, partial [Patescibacteria group bacterium]|nr:hypothetical protein [Patescibacteria group bacterium]
TLTRFVNDSAAKNTRISNNLTRFTNDSVAVRQLIGSVQTSATEAIAQEQARAEAAEAALAAQIANGGGYGIQRMTTAQRNALSPQGGEMIYNTTVNKFQGYQSVESTRYIDQDYFMRWSTIGMNFSTTQYWGQSFTPAVTDSLSGLTLSTYYSEGDQNYVVKIYEGDGTGGNLLSQQNVTIANINNYNYSSYNEVFIPLQGVLLNAGSSYTFVIAAANDNYRYMAMWFTSENNSYNYAGGKMYQNNSPFQYWYYWNGTNHCDMLFKTHMKGADALNWVNMR